MGLDMYLEREIYIGGKYEHRHVEGEINITIDGERVPVPVKTVSGITQEAGYWRKANAIHKWFVDNVQSGTDDCGSYDVLPEQLAELAQLCKRRLAGEEGLLPPASGFFFGSTEEDEWYIEDLKQTVTIVEKALENDLSLPRNAHAKYRYCSSW